jgi:hypothetical protein
MTMTTSQTNGGHGHAPGCACPFCLSTRTTAEATGVDLNQHSVHTSRPTGPVTTLTPDPREVDLTIQPRSAPHLPDRTGCRTCGGKSIAITAKGTYRKHYRYTYDETGTVINGSIACEATGEQVPTPENTFKPLTPRDVETLIEYKGTFADGYDDEKINRVLSSFESAHLVCVWDVYDDYGYGGNSEIVGTFRVDLAEQSWLTADRTYRRLHPEAWDFLSDPDSDIDPEQIPHLLDTTSEFAVYERQDIDDLGGDGFCNVSLEVDQDDAYDDAYDDEDDD